MAGYNLTVQLNLQGPRNLNSVVNNINQRLSNIQATVNVQTSPQTSQALQQIANSSRAVQQNADDAANSMEKFGRAAGLAIKRFAAFTAATAGFYAVTRATAQSLERFIEYDRQLTRIAQVTGSTKDSLSGLSNTITQLSVSLGASSSSLAEISVTLSQAGLTAKQTEQALKALALTTLAPSFDDINQTVEGSIALMRQFSISTNQLEKALGSINAVAAGFAVEASDIITAIQRTGGVFAAASNGVSQGTDALNEFIAVFTSVRATTRESAETIATGLRTIFTRLQREDTIEALKAFGVELTDLEGKFVGPFQAIQRLSEGLRTLDPRDLQFSAIVEELGGFRQVGKVIPLIQQFATAQQALNVAQRGSGSLATDAALGQQALGVQIAKVQQEFDALIRSIGQTKEFQQFIRLSLDLASALIQVADAVKPLVPALAALGAVGFARGIPSVARGFRRGLGATGYAGGGLVPGSGSGDTVPAMLTPGEFVIRKKAVQSIGVNRLSSMNQYARGGSVQRFQEGGMSQKEHFAHLDAGPNVYRDNKYWGKGLSGIGIMLPDTWNMALARGNAGISGAELKKYIENQKLEQTFARQLGLGKNSGQAGSFKGGRKNNLYDSFAKTDNMASLKASILSAIDPNKIYNSNADMYPLGKNMLAAAKNISSGMAAGLSKVGKVQLTAQSPLQELGRQAGDYDTISDKTLSGVKKLSFRQRTGEMFATRYRRRNRGGPINEVPALLTPGEFVINKDAASSLGRSTLNRLNNADRLPKYHSGGAVGNIQTFAAGGSVDDNNRRGIGSTIGLVFALQSAAGLFATSIEDASNEGAARMGGSIQGAVSGINFGLIGGEIAGFIPGLQKLAGPIGLVSGAALAAAESYIRAENAAIDFANKLDQQRISESADKISRSFETLAQDADNLRAINDIIGGIKDTIRSTNEQRNRQIGATRLSYGNLAERLFGFGIGPMTAQQTAAGTSEQTLAAQRSLVLEVKGFSAYLNTLGGYIGDGQIAQENLANEIRNINKTRAVESSREFASIADSATQLIEQRLKEGIDLEDILDTAAFKSFAEALARSNPEVERFILNTQANTELTQAEKDARIANVIATRGEIEARQRTIGVRKQLEIDSAKSAGRDLETILARVFQNMEQTFNAVATGIAQSFDKIDLDIKALSGKASIGLGQDVSKSVLENPSAYGRDQLTGVVNSLKPLLGDQANLIGNLAIASTEIEGKILSSINSAIKENPDANPEAIAGIVRRDLRDIVANLGLPSDLANVLAQQITTGIEELRSKSKDKIGLDTNDVRSSIVGFADTIDSLSGSMKVLADAQSTYRSALESYVNVNNTITDLLVSKNQYLQQSFEILSNSALKLDESFGRIITGADVSIQETNRVESLTGGLSDPRQIFDRILGLNAQRQMLQPMLQSQQDPGSFDQFRQLTTILTSTNAELNIMQQALRSVAESSVVADAALSDIARQQEKRQQQAGFLEQLVSSTPEQMQSLNQAYADMQRLLSGQNNTIYTSIEAQKAYIESFRSNRNPFEAQKAAQGVLAQERGNVLSLVKELGPFLGSSQEANNLRANVLGAQLSQLGLLTPQFAAIVDSLRNPQRDPDVQESIRLYTESVQKQTAANSLLSQIFDINAKNAEQSSATAIANAIAGVQLTLSAQSAADIARGVQPIQAPVAPVAKASGGVIYAAQGQMVNMMPKGTDTVPAMLTPGEFVVNKNATAKNRGLLESINSGKTRYYQYGGFVSPSFDGGESRQKTSQPLAPIEEWEKWSAGFERVDKSLFTAKSFVKFGGKQLDVREILPQDILNTTVTDTDRLKQLIYRNFSETGDIVPGKVSELIVERIGEFKSNIPETNVSFGTATRIAKALNVLGINVREASDIPENRYEDIASTAGITRKALLQYVKTYISKDKRTVFYDEEKAAERLSIYAAPYNKDSIITKINPIEAGLYGVSTGNVPRMNVDNKELTEKDFGFYKLNFNRLTSFIDKPPVDLPIVDSAPQSRSAFSWNISDGKYHNLYESFGPPTPFGISVNRIKTPLVGGYLPMGSEPGHYFDVPQTFRLSDTGNAGEVLSGIPYSQSYQNLKNNSGQIFELVQQHKDILNSGLVDDPQIKDFTTALMSLYTGTKPQLDLSGYARFFRKKDPPIMGLSDTVFRIYQQKAAEANDPTKFPFAESWNLGNNFTGITKNLGLLRTPEQIDKLKTIGNLERLVKDEDKQHYNITSVPDAKTKIQIPLPRDKQQSLRMRSLAIDVPTPYSAYSGDLYDDITGTFLTNGMIGIRDKGIPLYSNYDSFLNRKTTNDLMYNRLEDYQASIANQLNKNKLYDYIFNNVPYDPIISLASSGYFGSELKQNIYSPPRSSQRRRFSIANELLPQLDIQKNKLLKVEDFQAPQDQTAEDDIIVGRFNDMMVDSIRYWGGVRGPLATTIRARGLKQAKTPTQAKTGAASIRSMFLKENFRQDKHLSYRALAYGYGEAFRNIPNGVLNAFSRRNGNKIDVDTRGAALSFGQRYWLDQSGEGAPNLQLPDNTNFVNEAVRAVENNPQLPTTFGGLFDLFLNPYQKYNVNGPRIRGLEAIFNEMVGQRYYERQRKGPIPSADEARRYYNSLMSWYGGDNRARDAWIGQDGIAEIMSGIRDPKAKAQAFSAYTLSPQRYGLSNASHIRLGAGIYGSLPNLDDIARINGINPAAIPRVAGRARPFSEGGVALLNKALQDQQAQEQQSVNIKWGSGENQQTTPLSSDQFNRETLADTFKRFGASESDLRRLSEDQKRKRNASGPDPLFDAPIGPNATVGDAIRNIPGMALDTMGAVSGATTMLATAPGVIAEQGMNNLLGTDSQFMTDIYKLGLSSAGKPGERLATGIYSPETMNLPGSYVAGASQEKIMENMSGGSSIASTILDVATGFDPSDLAKIPKVASLAGLPALFPTFTRAATDIAGGLSQAAAQKRASTIFRKLAKQAKKGTATEAQLEDLRIWREVAASGLENGYPPEIQRIIDKYSGTPVFQPQAKTSSTPTTATVRVDIQQQAAEQQASGFVGMGLEADRRPKPFQGGATPQQTQLPTGRYVVDENAADRTDFIKPAGRTSSTAPTTATRASQAATQQAGQKRFRFTAIDAATGKDISDTIDAANEAEAQAVIRSMGYMVTNIKEGGPSLADKVLGALGFGGSKMDPDIAKLKSPYSPQQQSQRYASQIRDDMVSDSIPAVDMPRTTTSQVDNQIAGRKELDAVLNREQARLTFEQMGQRGEKFRLKGQSLSYDQVSADPELTEKALRAIEKRIIEKQEADFLNTVQGYSSGGVVKPKYLSNGGSLVNFAPKGTDTVSAMLTPGEFVVNAKAAKNNMGLLQSINSQGMSNGGLAKTNYLYGGGVATAGVAPPPGGSWKDFQHMIRGGPTFRPWRQGGAGDEYTDLMYWRLNRLEQEYGWMKNGNESQKSQYQKMELAARKGYGLDPVGRPIFNNPVTKYTDPMSTMVDLEILKFGGNPGRSFYGQPGMYGGSQRFGSYGYGGGSGSSRIPGLYNKGGKVSPKYLANGGQLVNFAPKGTDTVPAMLTPGEFVVNRAAAQKNLPLLNAINKKTGGVISNNVLYASDGASVGSATSSVSSSPITVTVETPEIDFTAFTNGVSNFTSSVAPLTTALQTFSSIDFGVINTGAQSLLTTSQNMGRYFSRFDTAVGNFSDKTNKFINALNSLKLDGTINVQGSIAMQPLTVNIAGLETIETRIKGIGSAIIGSLATALEQDNPGMSVTALRASTTLYE